MLSELQRRNSSLHSSTFWNMPGLWMQGELEEIFYFSPALVLSQSLFVYSIFSLPSASRSHSFPPEPLAVINPSIVPVTAEHAGYACLFKAGELITTSLQGPYRQQYMWCACDTMSEIHANALRHELYCWISHCAMQHLHYCWQLPYFIWKPPFTQDQC